MSGAGWTRRNTIRGLAIVAVEVALLLAARGASAASPGPTSMPRDREARRRWALARMDEVAQERLRCRERFKEAHQVRECEAGLERRHRAYNEVYLEAARE